MARKSQEPTLRGIYTTVCQTCGPLDGVESVECETVDEAKVLEYLHKVAEPKHGVYVLASMGIR